jgi:hypothetical protein
MAHRAGRGRQQPSIEATNAEPPAYPLRLRQYRYRGELKGTGEMDPWWVLVSIAGGWVLYFVIKAAVREAVYAGLARFLRDASWTAETRKGHDVSRRIDALAAHLVEITRQPPPDQGKP